MNFSTKLKSLILIGFKFRLMKIQLKSQNFRKKSYPWSSQNFRLRWINHGAKRAFFECFFKKTIYKVKIINLKKFRLYKVSWKVKLENFEVAKSFINRKNWKSANLSKCTDPLNYDRISWFFVFDLIFIYFNPHTHFSNILPARLWRT